MEVDIREAILMIILVSILVIFGIWQLIQIRKENRVALARMEAHFKPESDFSEIRPKVSLVFHNHPLGGWWLGLKKMDEGSGFWQLLPQRFEIYNENDEPIITGSYTFDFRNTPKNTVIVIAQGGSAIPVRTAMAYTGFGGQQLWAELDDWAPVEPLP